MLIRAGPVLVALPGRPPLPNKALELETLPQGPLLGKPKLRRGAEACFWSVWRCECVSMWSYVHVLPELAPICKTKERHESVSRVLQGQEARMRPSHR